MTTSALDAPADRLRAVADGLVLIVGCGRSGTTLLQSALTARTDVAIPPETKFYPAFFARRHGDRARCIEEVIEDQRRRGIAFDPDRFRALARAADDSWDGLFLALLAAIADAQDRARVGEKSPSHTPFVGHLAETFPRAKFIHVMRDPRAVVSSRVNAGFGTRLVAPHIDRWREAYDMHARYADALGDERYLLLRYEDLVTDTEATLRRVCAFLDLAWDPAMLTPHERAEKGFAERSRDWMENTLKPVFTSSIDKWRTTMPPAHVALVEHALAGPMRDVGYEPTGATVTAPTLRLAGSRFARWFQYRWWKALRGFAKLRRQAS